jgi:xanthine dehydrogenase small subunit
MSPTAQTPETRPIRFIHRGQPIEVAGADPTLSVLDWLRGHARCTGTKEGCAEGDCGACTVIVAELEAGTKGNGVTLRPVNACIRFLPTLDGKALLTVEDLPAAPAAAPDSLPLHPAQSAMVECHGSQCGFCTPGFVMSLAATYERHCEAGTRPDRAQLADDLAGNLCRCTGYRPILDAGERMFEQPPVRIDTAVLGQQLRALQAAPPLRLPHFDAPRTLAAFAALRAEKPDARLLAGCTDIGLWVNKQFRALGDILYIGEVAELKRISEADGQLQIGAAVTLEDGWQALVQRFPMLQALWLRFASPPVRHAGTLVGNLANGSPIGDGAPVLMALDATLLLRRGEQQRRLPLDAFYLGYLQNALQPGEFIEAVEVPLAQADRRLRAYKVSKRFDSDISALCGAFCIALDRGTVSSARLAFGGLAATVKRAAAAEAALVGQPWTEATLSNAIAALDTDFTPLTDLRASAAYRQVVAGQLLRRFWLETRDDSPVSAADLDVWHGVRREGVAG